MEVVEEANPISTVEYGGADDDVAMDEFHFDAFFSPTKPIQETTGTRDPHPHPPSSLAYLELLRKYGRGFKKLMGELILSNVDKISAQTDPAVDISLRLSTKEIMCVAGGRYVQFPTQMHDDYLMLGHPFGFALSSKLSEDETRDVELAHLLIEAAEKVSYQEYDRASKLLLRCEWILSVRANPMPRVVFHFTEALQERIEKEIGRAIGKGIFEPEPVDEIFQGLITITHPAFLTIYK